jgi:hypothetical protein
MVNPSTTLVAGSVVFYDTVAGLDLAKIGFTSNLGGSIFTPINDSFTFGIVKSVTTIAGIKKADVYLHGLIESSGVVASLLQPGETLTLGPLYLSKNYPGKLTAIPGGLSIYIGYALTADKFFLSPNNEALNQFFFNYKFNLLERPAGCPRLTSGVWSVAFPELTSVGWINAADSPFSSLAPVGATFFYNIPPEANVSLDTTLTAEEKTEAIDLRTALPPYPEHYTFMIINGLVQRAYTATYTDGKFVVNQAGLWWIGNAAGDQPWASDLVANVSSNHGIVGVTTNVGSNLFQATAHPLQNGDKIKLNSVTNQMPSPFNTNTYYWVINSHVNDFQLAAASGSSTPIVMTVTGQNTYVEFTPSLWNRFKGADWLRPRMNIHFVKVNPDYKLTTVTSLKSDSPAIKYVAAANQNIESTTGDLITKLAIANNSTTENPITNQAVKSVAYNGITGELDIKTGTVITELAEGSGIKIVTGTDGIAVISVSNVNFSGWVNEIEPENTRLENLGLHFYTNLTHPATSVPNGFVGKFLLPENLPTQNLQFSLVLFAKTTPGNGEVVKIHFEYAVSIPGTTLNNTITAGNGGNDISISFPSAYTAKQCFTFTSAALIIPAASLKSSSFVNFRISRKDATYLGDVGVVGIYWKIT